MTNNSFRIQAFGPAVTRFVPSVRGLAGEIGRDTPREVPRRREEAHAGWSEA